jgi:sulfur carrier protein
MNQGSTKIAVRLNGKTVELIDGSSIGAFLSEYGVELRMVAVEYNGEILARDRWNATKLQDGDVLEIVQMVGGG